jgi:hypothetical protein
MISRTAIKAVKEFMKKIGSCVTPLEVDEIGESGY